MTEHPLKVELYKRVRTDALLFDFLQQGSLDGLWYWDVQNPEEEWYSPEFCRLLGYDPAEVPHKSSWWQERIFLDDLQVALDNYTKHLADPTHPYDQVVRYHHKAGHTIWVRCRGIVIRDDAGAPLRVLGSHIDLTALKQAEAKLRRLVLTEPLTELLNRRGLEEILQRWLNLRFEGMRVFAAIIDLDDFKRINETHGHHNGDELLTQIAARFQSVLRASDAVGRIGGDEFCAIFLCKERTQAASALHRMMDALSEPFALQDQVTVRVTFSAGLVAVETPKIKRIHKMARRQLQSAKLGGKAQIEYGHTEPPPQRRPSKKPR